jgi:hypothetical protein
MIAASSPPLNRLLLYAQMDMAYDAWEHNVGKRVEQYETFQYSMRKITMAETLTATGQPFITLEQYSDSIIKEAYPIVIQKLREYIVNNSCAHSLPGAPPCLACIEAERPKIIESSLRYALASRPKPFGRMA